ncbi:MAG TPA: hypothetical protein VKN18_24285 [Blastocatellia bacterium]|nr:hypothetical protein [Blastocatellia bacterium]
MNSILVADKSEEKSGFWSRQFSGALTPRDRIIEILFGILLPLLCFYFDPGIIRGAISEPLAHKEVLVYSLSALSMLSLLMWLTFEDRANKGSVVLGGVMLAGAICSFSIGVLILPITIIGLFLVIGVLGFIPFFTGWVYLRNALDAIRAGKTSSTTLARVGVAALVTLLAIGIPATAQWKINVMTDQSIAEIISGTDSDVETAIRRIKRFHLAIDADKLVREYENEVAPERKERLRRAYKEITGGEIDYRLRILKD